MNPIEIYRNYIEFLNKSCRHLIGTPMDTQQKYYRNVIEIKYKCYRNRIDIYRNLEELFLINRTRIVITSTDILYIVQESYRHPIESYGNPTELLQASYRHPIELSYKSYGHLIHIERKPIDILQNSFRNRKRHLQKFFLNHRLLIATHETINETHRKHMRLTGILQESYRTL